VSKPAYSQQNEMNRSKKRCNKYSFFHDASKLKNPGDTFTRCGMGIPQGLIIAATLSHERHVNAVYF
jgi:hypothetical protein